MPKDFTISIYRELLETLYESGYLFHSFSGFIETPVKNVVILRHDVDARKENSLLFARIQHEMGIVGTYYFRLVPQSFDEGVIREIASMGHEIGYHYEDMDFAKGDVDKAYELAKEHLAQLREIADVQTICMHGSPRSPYDNKVVWKKYNYRELGIIAEPYFDLDFSKVLYLTDTGRRWDGDKVSIRDKVPAKRGIADCRLQIADRLRGGVKVRGGESGCGKVGEGENGNSQSLDKRKNESADKPLSIKYSFRSTFNIIKACKAGDFPNQIMMNFHPQRWTDNPIKWTQQLVWQNVKNVVKGGLVRFRG